MSASPPRSGAPVGLIGHGRMGTAFARRLLAAGHPIVVYDVAPDRAEAARAAGCDVATTVADLMARRPDVVLTSLATAAAFDEVVAGLGEAAATQSPGSIVADTSTLDLATKERGRQALADVGVTLLDCPVSGIATEAARGEAVVYASGPREALDQCMPVLRAMSRAVFLLGPFGTGSKTKYLANLLVGIHNAAAAEMLTVAARAGLDLQQTLPVVAAGAGGSRMLDARGPAMVSGEYGDGATIDLFRKDLGIIQSFASGLGAATPLLEVVVRLYEEAAEAGLGGSEAAAVHAVYVKAGGEEPTWAG